ncbi:universal stress protein [Haloechinothrix salitolerans]|uniref:Universal stress protein n=1 Tax=Haloechinothrix salitolerans TaxID=926830 RepID=A0ABW2C865_9PSEU
MTDEQRTQVVVGIDGSPGSVTALRWALRHAPALGSDMHAITAWEVPATFGYPPVYIDVDWEGSARETLDKAIAEAGEVPPGVTITADVVHGHPSNVLVAASKEADLLVVGSRGHSTVAGMLLGSVSQHCVHHAECPVVVVRGTR